MTDQIVTEGKLQAHECDNVWHISNDGSHVASATIATTRQRREDWTGERKFRVVSQSKASVCMTLGWKAETIVDGFKTNKGPVGTLRELMRFIEGGHMMSFACQSLEARAKKAGVSQIRILDAWNVDEKKMAQNLHGLVS